MRVSRQRLLIGIVVSCLWGMSALGQMQSQVDESGLGGMMASGQSRAQKDEPGPPWRLSLEVGGVFTDNRDAAKTNKQSNLDVTAEPRADFRYQDADRTWVELSLMPLLKWHSNPRTELEGGKQQETELFGAVGLELMHRLTPHMKLNAGDQLAYNDDPQLLDNGTTLRRNQSYILNDMHAGLESAFTAESGLNLLGEAVTTRYQDEVMAKELNSDQYRGEMDPYVIVGDDLKLIGLAGASEFHEETTERNRGSAVETYQAGVEKSFTPGLVGKTLGGYQFIQYDNSAIGPAGTLSGNAELVFLAKAPTRFRFNIGYGYAVPSDSAYSAQKATTISWAVDHDVIADRLIFHFDGLFRDGHYAREAVDAPGGKESMTLIGLHCTYFVTPKWSLTGGYSLENWDSTVRDSFTRNLVDLSVKTVW